MNDLTGLSYTYGLWVWINSTDTSFKVNRCDSTIGILETRTFLCGTKKVGKFWTWLNQYSRDLCLTTIICWFLFFLPIFKQPHCISGIFNTCHSLFTLKFHICCARKVWLFSLAQACFRHNMFLLVNLIDHLEPRSLVWSPTLRCNFHRSVETSMADPFSSTHCLRTHHPSPHLRGYLSCSSTGRWLIDLFAN